MGYAQLYIQETLKTPGRLNSLRDDFEDTLREMRKAFDVIIAQGVSTYEKKDGEKYFTLEEKLYGIYEQMKAEGGITSYQELTKDHYEYIKTKLRKT